MDVRSDVGQEAQKKAGKHASSADDWLTDTTQTAREGSEIFIRNQEVHDPSDLFNHMGMKNFS